MIETLLTASAYTAGFVLGLAALPILFMAFVIILGVVVTVGMLIIWVFIKIYDGVRYVISG